MGTTTEHLDASDRLIAREYDGLRWYRCLRCDSWLPLPRPTHTDHERLPELSQFHVPLRGKPLRDRFVLRLIALDRMVHVIILSSIAVAIFLFARHRGALHHDYLRILSDVQGGVGGPSFDTHRGIFPEITRLFSLSAAKLYLVGTAISVYTALLVVEAIGLWRARRWAEYLTLVETGSLVPFEIYELTSGVSPLKLLTLIINVAIVLYLLISKRLFGIRGGGQLERQEREADTGWSAVARSVPYLSVADRQSSLTTVDVHRGGGVMVGSDRGPHEY